jgi:hypothetical protein
MLAKPLSIWIMPQYSLGSEAYSCILRAIFSHIRDSILMGFSMVYSRSGYRFKCRGFIIATVTLNLIVFTSMPSAAATKEKTPPHILAAIKKGVAFIKKQQQANGEFAGQHQTSAGQAALAIYALRKSGVKASDPVIAKAIPLLLKYARARPGQDRHGIYNTGLVLLALESVHNQEGFWILAGDSQGQQGAVTKTRMRVISYKREITMCASALVKLQSKVGGWDYAGRGYGDLSQAQYAILGLWAAKRAGVKVPRKVFERCAAWLLKDEPKFNPQLDDGAFSYRPDGSNNHKTTMTPAGIGTLAIIYEQIKRKRISRVAANPKKPDVFETAIEKAFAWLDINSQNQIGKYYLYGLERACVLTGTKLVAKADWYRPQADAIVKQQAPDGAWSEHGKICGTAWALLFLDRATEQIPQMSKEALEAGGQLKKKK